MNEPQNNNVLEPTEFYRLFKQRLSLYAAKGININRFEFSAVLNAIKCLDCNTYIRDTTARAIPAHVKSKKHQSSISSINSNHDVHINANDNNENNNVVVNVSNNTGNNENATTTNQQGLGPNIKILSQYEKVINNVRIVYYIAKKGRPLCDFGSLLVLVTACEGQVSSQHYHNSRAEDEMLDALNNVQLSDDRQKIENAMFYSCSLDGNTIRTQTRVTNFARFYNESTDKIEQLFQGLMDVKVKIYDNDANEQQILKTDTGLNMFKILSSYINDIQNGWSKFSGGCSDHAPNMFGHRTGLKARVKEENPRSIWIGGQAHSLNLWIEHALRDKCPFYKDDESLIQRVYTIITGSYGRLNLYQQFTNLLNSKNQSPKKIYEGRWNGAYEPIKVYCKNVKSIIQSIQIIAQYCRLSSSANNINNQMQQERIQQLQQRYPEIQLNELPAEAYQLSLDIVSRINSFQTLLRTHLYLDLLEIFEDARNGLEKRGLLMNGVIYYVKKAILKMRQLQLPTSFNGDFQNYTGQHTRSFMEHITRRDVRMPGGSTTTKIYYDDVELSGTLSVDVGIIIKQSEHIIKALNTAFEHDFSCCKYEIGDQIPSSLSDEQLLTLATSALDIKNLHDDANNGTWLFSYLQPLLNRLSQNISNHSGKQYESICDAALVKIDYMDWRTIMLSKRNSFSLIEDPSERFITSWAYYFRNYGELCKNLRKVVIYVLSLEVTVVENERTHSIRKFIYSCRRSNLGNDKLDKLLRLFLNGPSLEDEQAVYNFLVRAMEVFERTRNRRFVHN